MNKMVVQVHWKQPREMTLPTIDTKVVIAIVVESLELIGHWLLTDKMVVLDPFVVHLDH